MHRGHRFVLVEVSQEEAANESGFPESRFTYYHQSEVEPPFHGLPVNLFRQRSKPDEVLIVLPNKK